MKRFCFSGGLLLLLLLGSCEQRPAFRLDAFVQEDENRVRLNEPLVFRFSADIDRSSIHEASVRITDDQGRKARGLWRVQGRELRFYPRFPLAPDCSDSGLEPGTAYSVRISGFPVHHAVLATEGEHLDRQYIHHFQTVSGDSGEWERFLDPEPESGPRLLAVGDVPFEDVHLSGVMARSGEPLMLTFSEPIYPPSVSRSKAWAHRIEGEGGAQGDPTKVELRSWIVTGPEEKGDVIAVEPRGGFQRGLSYKLWRDAIDFKDFGGNSIETASFSYIDIDCE